MSMKGFGEGKRDMWFVHWETDLDDRFLFTHRFSSSLSLLFHLVFAVRVFQHSISGRWICADSHRWVG